MASMPHEQSGPPKPTLRLPSRSAVLEGFETRDSADRAKHRSRTSDKTRPVFEVARDQPMT